MAAEQRDPAQQLRLRVVRDGAVLPVPEAAQRAARVAHRERQRHHAHEEVRDERGAQRVRVLDEASLVGEQRADDGRLFRPAGCEEARLAAGRSRHTAAACCSALDTSAKVSTLSGTTESWIGSTTGGSRAAPASPSTSGKSVSRSK